MLPWFLVGQNLRALLHCRNPNRTGQIRQGGNTLSFNATLWFTAAYLSYALLAAPKQLE